jgi:hypothetical protein
MKSSPGIPVTFSSIVGPRPTGCDGPSGTAAAGLRYIEVSQQIGGIIEPICVRDWTTVLEGLGLMAAGLKEEFFLSELPVPSTLRVWATQNGARPPARQLPFALHVGGFGCGLLLAIL